MTSGPDDEREARDRSKFVHEQLVAWQREFARDVRADRVRVWETFLDEMAARGTPAERLQPIRALVREKHSGGARILDALDAARRGASMARAAQIAGVPLEHFLELASAVGIPVLNAPPESVAEDMRVAEDWLAQRDFDDAEFRRRFDELERKWWPVLAALAHEPDADQVPTKCADEWLVAGPSERYQGPVLATPGKWCVERQGEAADDLWRLVLGAVGIGKLYVAKASGTKRASFYGDRHLIAVYTPDAADLEDVRRARAVLREMGVVEQIAYRNNGGDDLQHE